MYWQPRTTLQNSTPKLAEQNLRSISQKLFIIEYLTRLQDTNPLRSCSENQAKMLLKSHLGIKCQSQYNKVIRLLHHCSTNSWCRWLGMHCAWPGDYHCLRPSSIQFHPPNVTPLTNLDKVMAQGLCYCNSNAWGLHNQSM